MLNFKNHNYFLGTPERPRTSSYGLTFFCYSAAKLWNSLPQHFRDEVNFSNFKSLICAWNGESSVLFVLQHNYVFVEYFLLFYIFVVCSASGVRFTKLFRTELGHRYILVEGSVIALCLPVVSKLSRYKIVCYK